MIVYDLVCGRQHRFEGWFGSADDFARQRHEELIRCPMCDDAAIQRRPSANIQIGRVPESPLQPEQASAPASGDRKVATTDTDAQVANIEAKTLRILRKLVAETENVGAAFAEEARKIHYNETPKRGIRGQASSEEADALREEGIDFMSLPGFLTRDLN